MQLDLEDERLKAKVCLLSGDRARLTLEYPLEEHYRRTVIAALAEMLRPAAPKPNRGRGRPRKTEAAE